MASNGETKASNIVYTLKLPERCCVCGDVAYLVNYMGFEICPFCAGGEKEEGQEIEGCEGCQIVPME